MVTAACPGKYGLITPFNPALHFADFLINFLQKAYIENSRYLQADNLPEKNIVITF